MKILILTFLLAAKFCDSSPVTSDEKNEESEGDSVPEGICPLSKELGYSGIFWSNVELIYILSSVLLH
jgi:hypothetical protein